MKINKITIAIGLAVILGILILIGGIRITKANTLSQTLHGQEPQVLLARNVGALDVALLERNFLSSRRLDNLGHDKLLVALDARALKSVELVDRFDDLNLNTLNVLSV